MPAMQATLYTVANYEHWGRGAMIGAEASVLLDSAAELGKHHDRYIVGPADSF